MKRNLFLLSVTILLGLGTIAQPPKTPKATPQKYASDPWSSYRFFVGKWSGEGFGPAGKGPGTMTVGTDLDDSIFRVENQVGFASTDKKTTYRGIMIVSKSNKALFLDNEGHVLHYTVRVAQDSITFVSDPEPSSPRFRLIYQAEGSGKVKSIFDIAPMDTPNVFKIHVTGEATKE